MSNITQEKTMKYHKAFKEVYLLVNDLSPDLYLRIPKNFIKIIEENMDTEYDISLEELNTKGNMEETDILMSLIFRDFICSDELNQKLLEYDKKQIEQEIERYNNIFGNEEKNINEKVEEIANNPKDVEETSLTVVKEENIFKKIINMIKGLFKRK